MMLLSIGQYSVLQKHGKVNPEEKTPQLKTKIPRRRRTHTIVRTASAVSS